MWTDVPVTVDRGDYPDAVTPWEDEDWRAAALGWAERELAALGLRVSGERAVRLRPWSVLVRLPVDGPVDGAVDGAGPVWFKANPPDSRFEASLGEALAAWVPEHVQGPLAVRADRGWALLPDGGPLFRELLDRGAADARDWENMLRQYAAVQRMLVPHVDAIEALGVPSGRTADLPALFDRLLDGNGVLGARGRAELRALRPRLVDWCAELAATGIPDSLDHSDLHDGQIFAREPLERFLFFDWGDASVAHPFTSLLVTSRIAARRFGADVLPRLRDAYLEPWTDTGLSAAELRRAVVLATRLGAVGRAAAWGRSFPGAGGGPDDSAEGAARWLREVFTEEPIHT
ncbi:aminoglycoside phosphotransferase family protein [Streptomyces sp. NPDC002588]|uniref:aminoglycoside phosphotransferase family protein n=1 Tax=Streptomyces sp. NPDC002588 TaxID=3154419 RepID=UPI00332A0B8A